MGSYLRFLSHNKVYTAINVFGLSVSLMFAVLIGLYVYGEYTTDRIYTADRIYSLAFEVKDEDGLNHYDGCHHGVQDMLRGQFPEIESFCALIRQEVKYVLPDRTYLTAGTLMADSTFFQMFDFPLVQGDAAHVLEARDAAVVSEDFARRMFGKTDAVGQTLTYDCYGQQVKLKVTGVMGDMRGSCIKPADVVMPFWHAGKYNQADVDADCSNTYGAQFFILTKPGTHLEQKTELIDKCLQEKYPLYDFTQEEGEYVHCHLIPLREEYLLEGYDSNHALQHGNARQMHILFLAWLAVLAFAVINYVNLTVALSQRRAREMAVRRLVGAQRGMVMRQLMGESVLMTALCMVLALVLAWAAAPGMNALLQSSIVVTDVLQPLPLAVLVVFTLAVGLLSGIVPAVVLARVKPIDVVRGTFRHHTRMVMGRLFITLQNAVTITMLALSLVIVAQVRHLVTAPLGYNTHGVMSIDVNGSTGAEDTLFCQRLQALPSVKRTAWAVGLPLYGSNGPGFHVGKRTIQLRLLIGDNDYADILGLKRLTDRPAASGCRMYYTENLQQVVDAMSQDEQDEFTNTIKYLLTWIGVAEEATYGGTMRNFHMNDITQPDELVLVVIKEHMHGAQQILVETQGSELEAWRQVSKAYRSTFRQDMQSGNPYLDERVREHFASQRRLSHIMLLFSAVALLISFLGLVAMSTYFIEQRHREIAVRKVFGSRNSQVYRQLIGTFLSYVLVACAVSVPAVWYLATHWLSGFSYCITLSPVYLLAAGTFVLLVSLAAVSLQCHMAANANPVRHLKDE